MCDDASSLTHTTPFPDEADVASIARRVGDGMRVRRRDQGRPHRRHRSDQGTQGPSEAGQLPYGAGRPRGRGAAAREAPRAPSSLCSFCWEFVAPCVFRFGTAWFQTNRWSRVLFSPIGFWSRSGDTVTGLAGTVLSCKEINPFQARRRLRILARSVRPVI